MEKKVFRSRISMLMIVLILICFLLPVIPVICYGYITLGIIFWIIMALSLFAFRSLYYVLTEKEIQIYYLWGIMGKPFYKIPISGIISAERSYNLFWGASLKRIRFCFKESHKRHHISQKGILPAVSPVREQEFLETLKTLNPNIQINVADKKGWRRFWAWDI